MTKILLLSCVFQFFWLSAHAQVEHNFKKDPEKTNCHELETKIHEASDVTDLITSSSFRVKESMKISRYKVPNKLIYYSCDGKVGYLVAKENDSTQVVFEKIPRNSWMLLTKSKDPIEGYRLFKKDFESSRLE